MKFIRSVIEWLFPPVAYLLARSRIGIGSAPHSEADWTTRLKASVSGVAIAQEISDSELNRLRGLEEKLRGLLNYGAIGIPFIAGIIGLAWRTEQWWALGFGLFAALELVGLFFLSVGGAEARQVNQVVTDDLFEALEDPGDVEFVVAARRMAASELNVATSLNLQNAVAVSAECLRRAALWLGVAALLWFLCV